MDTVIITGANGEPALSIARRLCGMGIRVYALAGTIPPVGTDCEEFFPVACDPTSPAAVRAAVQNILEKEKHVLGVILAGQYLSEERFECISPEEIELAVNAQVVSPLCAVRLALPSLIAARGHVVVISPGAGTQAGRALNAVSDAATRAFAGTLFAELRDTGVKTCHILLQNNEGAPDPAARFTTAPQSRIHAEIVADAVETVFRLRENNALTQMILRPQATRETPHIPVSAEPKIRALQVVQLPPPKNFPPEEEPIPTPAYRRPDYAPAKKERTREEDDDGFSDDYVDPELRYLVKNPAPTPQEKPNVPAQAQKPQPSQNGGNGNNFPPPGEGKNRRKNRRRKNRKQQRNFDGAIRVNVPTFENPQTPPQAQAQTADAPQNVPTEKVLPPRESEKPNVPAEPEKPEAASNVPAPTVETPQISSDEKPAKRPAKPRKKTVASGKRKVSKKKLKSLEAE